MKKIIVIGGGASGMMAAGQAALMGGDVLLLEKMKYPGKKLAISGKGRCNLTNNSEIHEFISHFNRSGRFLHQPFSRFFAPQLMDFFRKCGVELIVERGKRVFPASGKSSDIVDALVRWLNGCGVKIRYSSPVTRLLTDKGSITGVACGAEVFEGDAVILSTGGASYPGTGSTGDGFAFATSVGHSLTPLRPALIPLVVANSSLSSLAGLDLKNVGMRVYINGKRKINDFGEMGFTHFGIGGPVILTHSLFIVDCLKAKKKVEISLDLKPALDESKLDRRLLRDFETRRTEQLASVLRGLLPQQLVETALSFCAIDGKTSAGEITSEERKRLRIWLKDFRLSITGHRPLSEAIITAGGIPVKEINPNTMESHIMAGLYITGELLDINGETGGYNLQAAFSTGWLAGRAAAADASSS
jgi:predicted Rossmann fold flavoprotein